MRRILVTLSIIFGIATVYSPVTHATKSQYIIDCVADDTDPADNTDIDWVHVSTFAVTTVHTTNCTYSCALGDVNDATTCGPGNNDSGAAHNYVLTGFGSVMANVPDTYGHLYYFVADPALFNVTAVAGKNSVTFNWTRVPQMKEVSLLTFDTGAGRMVSCSSAMDTACTITGLTAGTELTFDVNVMWDFTQADIYQMAATQIAATALDHEPETTPSDGSQTLADTGGKSESKLAVAIVLLALGIAASVLMRRRVAK